MKKHHAILIAAATLLLPGHQVSASDSEDKIKDLERRLAELQSQIGQQAQQPSSALRGIPADVQAMVDAMQKRYLRQHGGSWYYFTGGVFVQMRGPVVMKCRKVRIPPLTEAQRLNNQPAEQWDVWFEGATVWRQRGLDNSNRALTPKWHDWEAMNPEARFVLGTISRTNGTLVHQWDTAQYDRAFGLRLRPLDEPFNADLLEEAITTGN